jgi:hypothetical protein
MALLFLMDNVVRIARLHLLIEKTHQAARLKPRITQWQWQQCGTSTRSTALQLQS